MNKIKIGIVASEFNYDVTYAMVELAKEHANFLGAEVYSIIKVPGTFDMPLAVKILLEKKEISAVVALGAVIEGQTGHDEIIIQHASRKISDLSLEYKKPVALGISGPGMSRIEAHERVDYAKRAVEAAVKMCKIISQEENEIVNEIEITTTDKTETKKTRRKLPNKTENEITGKITKKTRKKTRKTRRKLPNKTENEITGKITKKTKTETKKTGRKLPEITENEITGKITKKGKKDGRKLPYGPIMKAFKGKFKDKQFTGNRTDIDKIISTLSGTPIESKGHIYDAGDLVKNIKNELLDGKISMPRKLMQAVSRSKDIIR